MTRIQDEYMQLGFRTKTTTIAYNIDTVGYVEYRTKINNWDAKLGYRTRIEN